MRIVVLASTVLALFAPLGCTPVRYDGRVAHGDPTGDPDVDAADPTMPMQDAAFYPSDAGHSMPPNDAWARPGDDAWVPPQPDAWVAPPPDAWTMPSCPTYTSDVQPIYQMHCASCHTTGGNPHFGSSYSVASESSSSCGSSMADCTVQRGQQGGDMSFRDPLGGFGTAEVQTIQDWINCGEPQ